MNYLISLRPTPTRYICQELRKEFSIDRIYLDHYEFVDFTVFEYGHRSQYFQWRLFGILMTMLLSGHNFFPTADVPADAPFYSSLVYMHVWLSVLVITHTVIEAILLGWYLSRVQNSFLVRIHNTPWYFQLLWLGYNTIYPNIMSCNVMYYTVIKSIERNLGESALFVALMACFSGIHVSVTAVPTRLAHIGQPIVLNAIHIAFTMTFQQFGLKNAFGGNHVYAEMDWFNSRSSALNCALSWLSLTCFFHLVMVICCWFRRLVYRYRRKRSSQPVYMLQPEEYYTCCEDGDKMQVYEMPLWDAGSDTPGEPGLPAGTIVYSPHMSYKDKSTWKITQPKDALSVKTLASPRKVCPTDPISGDRAHEQAPTHLDSLSGRKFTCKNCHGTNVTILPRASNLPRTATAEKNHATSNKVLSKIRSTAIDKSHRREMAHRLTEGMFKPKPIVRASLICKDCGFRTPKSEAPDDYKKGAVTQKAELKSEDHCLVTDTLSTSHSQSNSSANS